MKIENTYIMSFTGSKLYKDLIEKKSFSTKGMQRIELYSVTMPFSLELMRIDDDEFEIIEGKQCTNMFINILFDKAYTYFTENSPEKAAQTGNTHTKTKVTNEKIRKIFYEKGVEINGIKYCFYKRGASKAKIGSAIFVKENSYAGLISRSRLGVEFTPTEEIDLASVNAYQSLIMSGLEYVINIKPHEILIIDDLEKTIPEHEASVTVLNEGYLKTENKKNPLKNCLTDGQGLLDESVFENYKKSENGFMLLRSDWFKCCAFNTKLREFWKVNGVEEIEEMIDGNPTGRILKTQEIKLVITPNSLKWLKLADSKFEGSKVKCYLHWLSAIDKFFGVVKTDKEGNFGTANRMTYQLLNSLPLSKEEIEILAKDEIDYVMALKNDFPTFKYYIGQNAERQKRILKWIEDETDDKDEVDSTYFDMYSCILSINSDFKYTKKFKEWKSEMIECYIQNLRRGKLRLKNTIYTTIFSNPYEMLLSTIGKYDEQNIVAKGREIYCSFYEEGQELCCSRNPHVNSGNVACVTNKYHEEYRWFSLSEFCCIVNFADNDLPDRLQGCDCDSDTILLLPHEILVEKAKLCESNFLTPINAVKGENKMIKNTLKNLAKLDAKLANNCIGGIINLSQVANSYMWDTLTRKDPEKTAKCYYDITSKLSSMSQIEIDKSKKNLDIIKMNNELFSIKHTWENGVKLFEFEVDDKGNEKILYSDFFRHILENPKRCAFKRLECPMEYLQEVLNEQIGKPKKTNHIDIKVLLVEAKYVKGNCSNTKQISKIFNILHRYEQQKLNIIKSKEKFTEETKKKDLILVAKKEAVTELTALCINSKTVLSILRQAYGCAKDKCGFKKYSRSVLNLLFNTNKTETLSCFKVKHSKEDYLKRDAKGAIDIFGVKYSKVKK